jgi:hypothetical protein
MDYKEVMAVLPQDYNTYYEKIINDIFCYAFSEYEIENLGEVLKKKRDAGLKKYGELSFQSSFVNSMNSPTLEHAKEELLDSMNYIAHEIFKSMLLYPHETRSLQQILHHLAIIYENIEGVEEEKNHA